MLPQNRVKFDYLNISSWHRAGYRGRGITIGVIDGPYNHEASHLKNNVLILNGGGSLVSSGDHAIKVMDVVRQVLPEATIVYGGNTSMEAMINQRVDAISMSLSTHIQPRHSQMAFQQNIPLIKSAGNIGVGGVTSPGAQPEWVSVAALDLINGRPEVLSYSSMGGEVEVSSITNMSVTTYGGRTASLTGTSGAAPVFASMLLLMMSGMRRKLPIPVLRSVIYKYCKDIYIPGEDIHTGHGVFLLPRPGSVV